MFRQAAAIAVVLCASPAMGQWLDQPTPGIPRTADGKPNLTAPAPMTPDGKPDLSGIWKRKADRYYNNVAADLKPGDVLPWADALYQQRRGDFGKNSMEVRCLPLGPAATTTPFADFKILQMPTLVAILLDDLTFRQVHMDGRQLPKDPNPSWMGYSVGQWEGDTLVVESTGFTDRSWLDYDGHPHTEALRVVERFRRRDFGHLSLEVTFEDPGAYARPWTVAVPLDLVPDTEILEAVCRENEKDFSRMSGGPAGQPAVDTTVPRETLARYAGDYEIQGNEKIRPVMISLSGDALFLNIDDTGPQRLFPMSGTSFSYSGTVIQFVANGQGAITHFLMHAVEGEDRADRKR
jgi:hypothetical protein